MTSQGAWYNFGSKLLVGVGPWEVTHTQDRVVAEGKRERQRKDSVDKPRKVLAQSSAFGTLDRVPAPSVIHTLHTM